MKNLTITRTLGIITISAVLMISACDPNAKNKTLGNSRDTIPLKDTSNTNNKDTSANNAQGVDTAHQTSKGNVDPSGRMKNR